MELRGLSKAKLAQRHAVLKANVAVRKQRLQEDTAVLKEFEAALKKLPKPKRTRKGA